MKKLIVILVLSSILVGCGNSKKVCDAYASTDEITEQKAEKS